MKRITDERLILKNLKVLRVGFIVLYIGVVSLLAYEAITNGWSNMLEEPLWLVWMITNVVMAYLQISISVDHEETVKQPGSYFKVLLISLIIGLVFGILVTLTPGSGIGMGILIGGVVFVCFLAPFSYIYYLRKKRYEDLDEE